MIDEATVDPLVAAVGRPQDQIRLCLIMFAGYPLGWFMYYFVHGTTARHLFNIVMGILIQLYLYGTGIIHVILMASVAYALMIFLPRKSQAQAVMIWVLLYLSYQHLLSVLYHFGSYEMDTTSYTMLLVCKLSALAFCYQDGATDREKLNKDQLDRMVLNLPSPI